MATALLRATVGLLRAMATVRLLRSPDTAILHLNRATRRPASASRRRDSRATSSCRRGRLRGHLRDTARLKAVRNLLTPRILSRAARRLRTRLTRSRVGKARLRTRLTLNNKRHRNTGHRRLRAVLLKATAARLLRATEARHLSNTAVRLLRAMVRLRPRASITARLRAALPRKGNNTARHRRLLRRRTTALPPTRPAPTARRLGPQGRRIEFAETIIPTFAETYRDTL